MALGVVFDEASDVAVREALADFDAAVRRTAPASTRTSSRFPPTRARFFEPAVWERLRAVKALYDPADVFAGNHHVPPARA